MRGDYHRAGRAWKLILSLGRGNMKIDERAHSRWGIAAELHLHANRSDEHASGAQSSKANDAMFSEEGFKAARMYYERLILEHPFQQSHPKATSALTFYPAMFSLWIYEVSQASRAAIAAAETPDSAEETESEEASDSEDNPNRHVTRREARILAARTDELRRAREIAARLDDLLASPHYDKRPDLLHLRGMVAVWVGDLVAQIHTSERIIDSDAPCEEDAESEEDAERAEHIAKARDLFRRARAHGGRLSEGARQILDAGEG